MRERRLLYCIIQFQSLVFKPCFSTQKKRYPVHNHHKTLHKLYAESKNVRTEFQQVGIHGYNCRNLKTQGVPSNTLENVLYGSMGIATDLDKLGFETEKRCVVQTKNLYQIGQK
jgi:hypothetical protein